MTNPLFTYKTSHFRLFGESNTPHQKFTSTPHHKDIHQTPHHKNISSIKLNQIKYQKSLYLKDSSSLISKLKSRTFQTVIQSINSCLFEIKAQNDDLLQHKAIQYVYGDASEKKKKKKKF